MPRTAAYSGWVGGADCAGRRVGGADCAGRRVCARAMVGSIGGHVTRRLGRGLVGRPYGRQLRLLDVVGDAARYLDVNPSNVARRYDILRHGVSMLRKFHEAHDEKDGKVRYQYGRVVLVGHSLGSVIAYDIIKHYWADVNGKLKIEGRSAELLKAVAGYDPPPMAEFAPPHGHKDRDRFRQAQANAWSSINEPTSPAEKLPKTKFPYPRWLVSDLVTLGSPLAYARLLLADGPSDLKDKVRLRELPTCPPDRSTTDNPGYIPCDCPPRRFRWGTTTPSSTTRRLLPSHAGPTST